MVYVGVFFMLTSVIGGRVLRFSPLDLDCIIFVNDIDSVYTLYIWTSVNFSKNSQEKLLKINNS